MKLSTGLPQQSALSCAGPPPHQLQGSGTHGAALALSDPAALPTYPTATLKSRAAPAAQSADSGNASSAEPSNNPEAALGMPAHDWLGTAAAAAAAAEAAAEAPQDACRVTPASLEADTAPDMPAGTTIPSGSIIRQLHNPGECALVSSDAGHAAATGPPAALQHQPGTAFHSALTHVEIVTAGAACMLPADAPLSSGLSEPQGCETAMRAAQGEATVGDQADDTHTPGILSGITRIQGGAALAEDEACLCSNEAAAVLTTAGAQLQAAAALDLWTHPNDTMGSANAAGAQHQAAQASGSLPPPSAPLQEKAAAVSEAAKAQLQAAAAKRAATCAALPSGGWKVTPRDFQLQVNLAPLMHSPALIAQPSRVSEPSKALKPLPNDALQPGTDSNVAEPSSSVLEPTGHGCTPEGRGLQSSGEAQPSQHGTEADAKQQQDGTDPASSPLHGMRHEQQPGSPQTESHKTPAGAMFSKAHCPLGDKQQADDVMSRAMATPMEGVLEREAPRPAAGAQPPAPLAANPTELHNGVPSIAPLPVHCSLRNRGPESERRQQHQQAHGQQQRGRLATLQEGILDRTMPTPAGDTPGAERPAEGMPKSDTGTPLPHFGLLPPFEVRPDPGS